MSLSTIWTRLFRRRAFKDLTPEDRSQIQEAFTHKGVKYFTFKDIFRLPTTRGLQALDYYDEFSMRCTKSYLTKVCEAFEVILSNPKKLDLITLATLVKHMRERIDMLPVPDHIYKLASVMFFDSTENPYFFDREYAQKKIDLWKKDPEVLDFFLRQPLKGLIPYLNLQEGSLHTFSVVTEAINKLHKQFLSEVLSRHDMKVDM
jgi:hypothetical protein